MLQEIFKNYRISSKHQIFIIQSTVGYPKNLKLQTAKGAFFQFPCKYFL